MPPKRSKSQTGSAGAQKWESGLLTTQFTEEVRLLMETFLFIRIMNDKNSYSYTRRKTFKDILSMNR